MKAFDLLLERMKELKDLKGVIELLSWDQETYVPQKGEAARADAQATVQGLYHERLVDPRVGDWLAAAAEAPLSEDQQAMLRIFRRDRDRAVKVPGALVKAIAEAQSSGLIAWRKAREERRFGPFAPALRHILALRREQADAFGHEGNRYDALLEGYEPGMRVARLTPVLTRLKEQLVPLVAAIAPLASRRRDPLAGRQFPKDAQWRFTLLLLEKMGFDLQAGRQDLSIHPFSSAIHPLDVRLTTSIHEDQPLSSIFSSLHEGGHGLYEQGFSEADWRTPLASAASMGMHESQSRLWENFVGRSRPFWEHAYPLLRSHFPVQLEDVSLDDWLFAANRVERSLIRTEADEVTYNLHVVLRYELELLLLADALPLDELPAAWNEKMASLLGKRPKDDLEGVLQDIHWAWGELGYFPTYALGNLYAAAIFKQAEKELAPLEAALRKGELFGLRDWLREKVHRPGFRLPAEERVRAVTGEGLTDAPFLDYLRSKYGALYGVRL